MSSPLDADYLVQWLAKSSLLPVFVNKVLSKLSHTYDLPINYGCLCAIIAELSSLWQRLSLSRPKTFTSPLQKKSATPNLVHHFWYYILTIRAAVFPLRPEWYREQCLSPRGGGSIRNWEEPSVGQRIPSPISSYFPSLLDYSWAKNISFISKSKPTLSWTPSPFLCWHL